MEKPRASRTAVLACQGRAVAGGRIVPDRFGDGIAALLVTPDEHAMVARARDDAAPLIARERLAWERLRACAEGVVPRTVLIDEACKHPANGNWSTHTEGVLRLWPASAQASTMVEVSGRTRQKARSGSRSARLPPRWFIVMFWHAHRALVNATRGRLGLWRPKPGRWGALRLTTVGRRTARPRAVVVGYFEDGDNVVTMAMNGWGEAEPAWWLNLQAHPDATVQTRDGVRLVRAHRAEGAERERLWSRWAAIDRDLDAYAARRPAETAVVVLEPRREAAQP